MAVQLVMLVTRGQDNGLSGIVRLAGGSDDRNFSGTLGLLRVFEDLVPVTATADDHVALPSDSNEPASGPSAADRRNDRANS